MVTSFGLIGCGRIGRLHARNIAAHARAKLLSCYDVAADAAQACASELGIPSAPSLQALLESGIDAVFIASATDTHVDLITRAVRDGKAVLCEKPIDLDMARVEACERDIGALTGRVMLGFNRRFDPSFKALHDRLHAGEIGAVEQVVITSRDPAPPPVRYLANSGGLFRDMTIHDFDMARYLAGEEPVTGMAAAAALTDPAIAAIGDIDTARYLAGEIVEVQAMGANLIDPEIGAAGDIDAAMIVMRAASGALVHINNSRRCAYGYDQRIEAFGAGGMLLAGNQHPTSVEAWGAHRTHAQDPVQDFFIARYADAYRAEIDHFVDCLANGEPFLAGFADGKAALGLANAALASLHTGRAVRVGAPP